MAGEIPEVLTKVPGIAWHVGVLVGQSGKMNEIGPVDWYRPTIGFGQQDIPFRRGIKPHTLA